MPSLRGSRRLPVVRRLPHRLTPRRAKAGVARDEKDSIRQGGDRRSEEARIKHNGVMFDPVKHGNSSAYLLRRIARSSPETLANYEAGRHTPAGVCIAGG